MYVPIMCIFYNTYYYCVVFDEAQIYAVKNTTQTVSKKYSRNFDHAINSVFSYCYVYLLNLAFQWFHARVAHELNFQVFITLIIGILFIQYRLVTMYVFIYDASSFILLLFFFTYYLNNFKYIEILFFAVTASVNVHYFLT